jgi:hypothetical protein
MLVACQVEQVLRITYNDFKGSFTMQQEAYWGLTTSSTFPQSTPKIVISGMKW